MKTNSWLQNISLRSTPNYQRTVKMGRKAKEYTFSLLNLGDNQNVISEAKNMARWNPSLAIYWMEEILVKVVSPIEIAEWNKSAKKINETIDSIESHTNCYIHGEYWKNEQSRRLTLQEVEISLEDYLAMEQYHS